MISMKNNWKSKNLHCLWSTVVKGGFKTDVYSNFIFIDEKYVLKKEQCENWRSKGGKILGSILTETPKRWTIFLSVKLKPWDWLDFSYFFFLNHLFKSPLLGKIVKGQKFMIGVRFHFNSQGMIWQFAPLFMNSFLLYRSK